MKELFEQWRKTLKERVYSDIVHSFAKLLRATIDADVDPYDMHAGNLGHDGKWNIKILDAG